ncbi:MAG: hypothetical protein KBT32_08205 [Bacteroidales bacterium]|nr:hypothetical protein [Candidatus Physcocola equi]
MNKKDIMNFNDIIRESIQQVLNEMDDKPNADTIWMDYMRLFERFAKFTKERYKKAHIGTKNEMPITLEEVRDLKAMIENNLNVSFK